MSGSPASAASGSAQTSVASAVAGQATALARDRGRAVRRGEACQQRPPGGPALARTGTGPAVWSLLPWMCTILAVCDVCARLRVIPDVSKPAMSRFVTDTIESGVTVRIDGWLSYRGPESLGTTH